MRGFEHSKAVTALNARVYQGADPIRVSAFAYPGNPFHWYGVAETYDFYARVEVVNGEVDPLGQMTVRYKPEPTEVAAAAKKTYLGRVFMEWARFPLLETEERSSQKYNVQFLDMRFLYPGSNRAVLSPREELNHALKPIAVWWGQRADPNALTEDLR